MSQKHNNTFNSQQMKSEIQNLSNTRQAIQNSKDISGQMVKLGQTMKNLKPLMTKQSQYIKNFLQNQGSSAQSSQQSQVRRYINRIQDISISQIHQLLMQGDKYFTLDLKTNWKKIIDQIQKQMIQQKQKIQSANPTQLIQFIFKVINVKDKFYKEFLKSLIYRKLVLCKDLSIQEKGFIHAEKKVINKLIQSYQLSKNYIPTKPQYQQFNFTNIEGLWNLNQLQNTSTHISQIFGMVNLQIQEIYSIIRNYSNLNQDQRNKQQIKRNDNQVTSLRQKIQLMNKNYQILQKKYRQTISKDQKIDVTQLKEKLKFTEQQLQQKQLELKELKYQFRDSSTQIQALKQKVNDLTSDLQKITKQQLFKLKQLQYLQTNLNIQFTSLSKSIKSFGNIFQFENDGKRSLAKQIIFNKQTISKMAQILGREKNKNKDLQNQIKRLNQIILELGERLILKRANQQQ